MTTILIGECTVENRFELQDPDAMRESEFEYKVAKTLMCIYPGYRCYIFSGSFRLDDRTYKPDLALIANDFSHWFIIEVELLSHSFENHVLPQVRAFRYGAPQADCISSLVNATGHPEGQIKTLLRAVPRTVAVIANKPSRDWEAILRSHQIQFLSASVYLSAAGLEAVEIDGRLEVVEENLGFGLFLATDRTLRFPRTVRLPDGDIQIAVPDGGIGAWRVTRDEVYAWVTKVVGAPDLPDQSQIQVVRAVGGRLSIRRPVTE